MSDHNYNIEAKSPSNTKYVWTGIGFIGLILAIGILVSVLYFPNRLGDPMADVIAQRKVTLSEVVSKEKKLISEYAWIDKANGIVRVPVGQAMKLVVDDLSKHINNVK